MTTILMLRVGVIYLCSSIIGATGRNDVTLLETLLKNKRLLPQDELSRALHRAAELGLVV